MMVGEEPPAREVQEAWQGRGGAGEGRDPLQQRPGEVSPVLTTVTFRLGLWTACPHINTSHLHASQHLHIAAPQCSSVSYGWRPVTHKDLKLPAPAPLMQTVLARMRLSTMFLVGACGLLGAGCLLAVVGRCCYSHAALLAALLYSLAGLSVGVGVVWFVSVVSEEYGVASGRGTSWSAMYAYRYGWSLMAAGGAGVSAMLAALLTGHAHLGRHAPLLGTRTSTEESLARPLLRCRSEGCLGQRSFTSDTIRTYLTCDSRRHASRSSHVSQPPSLHQCSSIVDLTRPQEHPPSQSASHMASRRSSRATVLSDDTQHLQQHPPKEQQHTQTQEGQQEQQEQDQIQQKEQLQQQQKQQQQQQQQQQQGGGRAWPGEPSRVIIEAPQGVLPPVVPPPPLSSSSSSPSPLDPPLPLPAVIPTTSSGSGRSGGAGRLAKVEPPRVPEYSSFKGDYTRSLPREARQMAVFERRGGQRSATLSRPPSKVSSEV